MMPSDIDLPNYTQFPNVLLDHWLPILSPYEFCILSYMVRKIFGFHKRADKMSISQIAKGTGQAVRGVINHIKSLIKHGLIIRYKGKTDRGDDDTNLFTINTRKEPEGHAPDAPPVVHGVHKGVVHGVHTQKKTYTKENPTTTKGAVAPAAAVFDCLKDLEIPQHDKLRICQTYDEATVQHAVAYCRHPETKIKTSLVQVLQWACKEKPALPVDKASLALSNEQYARQVVGKLPPSKIAAVDCLSNKIEVRFVTGSIIPIEVHYDEGNFKDKLKTALKRFGGDAWEKVA
jgi:hypothetical protein